MGARLKSGFLIVGLIAVAAACGSKGTEPTPTPDPPAGGGPEPVTINIPSSDGYGLSSFAPDAVTVPVGRTIVWRNGDTVGHTSTSDTGIWNGTINPNGSYSRTFSAAGTFTYKCTIHAGMAGTVTVQ